MSHLAIPVTSLFIDVTWRERAARDLEWLGEGGEGVVEGLRYSGPEPPGSRSPFFCSIRQAFPKPEEHHPVDSSSSVLCSGTITTHFHLDKGPGQRCSDQEMIWTCTKILFSYERGTAAMFNLWPETMSSTSSQTRHLPDNEELCF